jgi:hypothetical protein
MAPRLCLVGDSRRVRIPLTLGLEVDFHRANPAREEIHQPIKEGINRPVEEEICQLAEELHPGQVRLMGNSL